VIVPWYRSLTRYQWLVLLVAWLGWVFDIMDTSLFNFAKTPMLKELMPGVSNTAVVDGAFLTILLVGWSVGGLVFGVLADRWGRVRTLTFTVLIYCVFTALTAVCTNWQEVAVIRFITALGIGGEWAAGAALLAEAFPDKARAPGAAWLQSAAAFGPWFAALVNLAIPPAHWRMLFLIGVFPALLTVLVRLGVKEPERWKREVGASRESWFAPLKSLLTELPWKRHALIALAIGVCGIAAANNVSYWLPNLNEHANLGFPKTVIQNRLSYVTLTLHIGTLLGVLLVPWLCERFGRRKALALFFLLSPMSVALVAFVGVTYERLIVLAPVMSFFTIGMSAGFVLYFPELFPTRLRATGAGLAYNGGRIIAAGIPLLTGYLIGSSKSVAAGVGLTALIPILGIAALAFAPETRGKPLPE
jgi:MFS family permease